jgi:3D (Asp-Asp-Asp) domain-containing protein
MAAIVAPGLRRLPDLDEGDNTSAFGRPIPASTPTRAQTTASPQYAIAANPTLTNADFTSATGWQTTGNVGFASNAATLKEVGATQTRLNQVFVVGPNDRYLSFKITDLVLDDVSNAPDDAFEAALIDANTGLSLLGSTGLTKNDAFLNLQANGNTHKGEGVTTIDNADGSRTVVVDLEGIPEGTIVNLSFDLIGFGYGAAATNSHVTIGSLHLGEEPETNEPGTNEPGTNEPGCNPKWRKSLVAMTGRGHDA